METSEKGLRDDNHVAVHLPTSSHLLSRLYANHGVRVRMVRKHRTQKIPTVKELIDQLAKKHERLLGEELEERRDR